MSQIVLDNIAFSGQKSGGVSVVWMNLIKAIQNERAQDLYCLEYPSALDNICRKQLSIDNVEIRNPQYPFFIERRLLNPRIDINKPFVFHSSYYRLCNNKKALNVTTVHDFIYEKFGKGISKFFHCRQKYKAIRKSNAVVCITENTKKDLLKYLPDVEPAKIRVIYNGVSDVFHPLENKTKGHLGKYILFVGQRKCYKNFKLTVESIKDLDHNLAIVGPPLRVEEIEYLNNMVGNKRYKSYVRISDDELNELYNSAFCLSYPSIYEGFGIPILEAQRAGCPVIAYNGSSIPEVIGKTPLLLNTLSTIEFQDKLRLLEDNQLRETIITEGFQNASRFSWEKMGEEYLQLYKELESNNL